MQSNANVLQVENIITRFNTQDGKVFAVNGISFDLKEGELLGVVGESGSGKSVTMMSLLKLLPMPPAEIVEGRALFENQDLIQMDLNQLRKIRGGKIGFIFQDPMTSLNPVLTVGYQLMEPMREQVGIILDFPKPVKSVRSVFILKIRIWYMSPHSAMPLVPTKSGESSVPKTAGKTGNIFFSEVTRQVRSISAWIPTIPES